MSPGRLLQICPVPCSSSSLRVRTPLSASSAAICRSSATARFLKNHSVPGLRSWRLRLAAMRLSPTNLTQLCLAGGGSSFGVRAAVRLSWLAGFVAIATGPVACTLLSGLEPYATVDVADAGLAAAHSGAPATSRSSIRRPSSTRAPIVDRYPDVPTRYRASVGSPGFGGTPPSIAK